MNEFYLSGSYAAGTFREPGDLEIALSCMDQRIGYVSEGIDYLRAVRTAGGNNYMPQEIYEFANLLGGVRVRGKRITIIESHDGCGGGLAGYLKYLETQGIFSAKGDVKQHDVDTYSKKYARSLADIMSEKNKSEPEVRAFHLSKKDMEKFGKYRKSTSNVIYVSREPFDSTAYRNQFGETLVGGYIIGGAALPMEKYIESVVLALNLATVRDKHGDGYDSCTRPVNIVVVGKSGNKSHIHTPRSLAGSSDLFHLLEGIANKPEYAGRVAITQLPVRPECKNFSANAIPRHVPGPDAGMQYSQHPVQALWETIMAEPTVPDTLRL